MKILALAASVAGLVAASALAADRIDLAAPLAGASLHEGTVAMSVYYVDRGEQFEVVATYLSNANAAPARMTLALADGDNVHFGLPGKPGILFGFARNGGSVEVTSETLQKRLAENR